MSLQAMYFQCPVNAGVPTRVLYNNNCYQGKCSTQTPGPTCNNDITTWCTDSMISAQTSCSFCCSCKQQRDFHVLYMTASSISIVICVCVKKSQNPSLYMYRLFIGRLANVATIMHVYAQAPIFHHILYCRKTW